MRAKIDNRRGYHFLKAGVILERVPLSNSRSHSVRGTSYSKQERKQCSTALAGLIGRSFAIYTTDCPFKYLQQQSFTLTIIRFSRYPSP